MLNVGAARLDVTPPLGEGGRFVTIHDPLLVRAFVVERRDDAAIALVVCDETVIQREYCDRAKQRIQALTGLAPERVMISCTHTHTAPFPGDAAYWDFVARRIGECVQMAWHSREPAQVGWGRATETRLAFNRRYKMRDGTVQTNPRGSNPGRLVVPMDDVVGPAGPTDPEVGLLCFRRPAGSAIGAFANYTIHYIGADARAYSADYVGYFDTLLQRLRGENFVAAVSSGAAGDVNAIDVMSGIGPEDGPRLPWSQHITHPLGEHTLAGYWRHTERAAGLLAAATLWAWNGATFDDDVAVDAITAEVRLKRRPLPTDAEVVRARDLAAREARGEPLRMDEWSFHRRVLNRMPDLPPEIPVLVQALRVGDLGIVALPGEAVVELGLELKRRSPFGQTIVVNHANDWHGYIPTRRAYDEGGYEPNSSVFAPGEGEHLVEEALTLLNRISHGRRDR